ncbi:hypothetical protein DM2_851 [Halorubrum sp. DM2]|nr:hypothetical protein DM2_851 [Halorubrum sp. DM2]
MRIQFMNNCGGARLRAAATGGREAAPREGVSRPRRSEGD